MRRIRDESKKLLAQERQLRLNDIRLRGADSGAGAVGFVGEGGPSESAASSSVSKRAWADTALGVLNDLLRLAFKIHSPDWRQQVCVCVCVCAGVCMRFRLAVILVNGSSMLASRIELRTMHENARKKSAHSLSRTHARMHQEEALVELGKVVAPWLLPDYSLQTSGRGGGSNSRGRTRSCDQGWALRETKVRVKS